MERNFKVGDKVRIRQWDDMAEEFGMGETDDYIQTLESFVEIMKPLCGKKAKIRSIDGERVSLEDFENCEGVDTDFSYSTDMLEHVEEKMTSNAVTNLLMDILGLEVGGEFDVPILSNGPFHFREDGCLVDCKGSIRKDIFGQIAMGLCSIQKIPVKEMTLEEIEKELGYKIKIVAGKEKK